MIKVHLTGPDGLALTNTDITLSFVRGIMRQQLAVTTDHDGNISLDAKLYSEARFRSSPAAMLKESVKIKDGTVLKIVKMATGYSLNRKRSHDDQPTMGALRSTESHIEAYKKSRNAATDRVNNRPPVDPAAQGIPFLMKGLNADEQTAVAHLLALNPTKTI